MRILLAEDDPLLGDGLRAGLRQLGFQVDWVRDGEAAERELRAEPYAAAVLDLGLPRLDGLDVLARTRRAGVTLPVLVLTARDAVPDRIRGLDLGADDYVVKPVDLHELAARLRVLVLGAVTLTWIAAAVLTALDARHELDELLDGHLAQAAALLVVQQARTDGDDDEHGVDAPTLHKYAPKVAFQVWHEGKLSMRSSNAPRAPMHPDGEHFRPGLRTLAIGGERWRVFAAHGAEHDVQVYVGEQLSSRAAILRAVLRSLGLTLALALPLLALAAWAAVRGGLQPLRRLGAQLAQRQPQALQPMALPRAPTELQPLLDALNGLFGRIAALIDSERRFTADAAHELRTPIAAIRTQAQVALGETDDLAARMRCAPRWMAATAPRAWSSSC